jgi:heme exporter protein D
VQDAVVEDLRRTKDEKLRPEFDTFVVFSGFVWAVGVVVVVVVVMVTHTHWQHRWVMYCNTDRRAMLLFGFILVITAVIYSKPLTLCMFP